ncbi:MAG TPA: AzlC family ABC transporter permease [Burkholderiaceae bacterium]|jgi:predicted branched-subunit amino acid permease
MSQAQPATIEKQAFREAVKVSAPTMPGIFAWGMVTSMAMVKSGLTIGQALGMTLLAYAGSAQLAALPLIAANASVWVVFATAMLVNLRFVIFAAAIGPHLSHLPWYKRLYYGYLNGDLIMAIFPARYPYHTLHQPAGKLGYYLGICYPNWCAWQAGSVIGIILASQIPNSWGIAFAGTLALLGVMIPLIVNAAALAGVIVAAAVAVAAIKLPYRLGLVAAVLLGMAVAMLADTIVEQRRIRSIA